MLVDALLGCLVTMTVGIALVFGQRVAGAPVWPAYGFALGFGVVLLGRRRHPVVVLVLTWVGICVYYALAYPPIGLALPVAAALFSAAEYGHLRLGIVVAAGLVLLAIVFLVADGRDLAQLLGYEVPPVLALTGAALALGDGTRSRRLLRESQQGRERQARFEQEHRAAERRAAERLGLARDLHDTLGHHLSVMLLQSAVAAEALPERTRDAEQAMRDVRRAGRDAMTELRDTVTRLRTLDEDPDPSAGLDRLPELVERVRRSGLNVDVRSGVDGVPAEIGQAAYLIVQEAVTNVIRHADATTIELEVATVGDRLLLSVGDDGRGPTSEAVSSEETPPNHVVGHGIRGMRERAEGFVGQLTVTRRGPDRGVLVRAELPLHPPASVQEASR